MRRANEAGDPNDDPGALYYLLGLDDIEQCLKHGDRKSCAMLVIGMAPTGRLGKAAKLTMRGGEAARLGLKSVDEVLEALATGRRKHVRVVDSVDELHGLWDELATGGVKIDMPRYDGTMVMRPDGVRIGLRPDSKSGQAAIDIEVPGNSRPYKIHVK